jgi:hypothetical protein
MGQVTGLLLFFGGRKPFLVVRLSRKESAGLLWRDFCLDRLLMRM